MCTTGVNCIPIALRSAQDEDMLTLRLTTYSLLALALGAACGGQTGEVAPDFCDGPVGWTSLDDNSLTGFDANELLATVPASSNATLTWDGGEETSVTLNVAHDTEIQNGGLVATVNPESDACVPRLEVPVSIELETADGKLRETLIGYLLAESPDSARLQADLYANSLTGSLDLANQVPSGSWDPNTARLFFDLTVGDEAAGTITVNTHQEGGEQANLTIASW